MPPFINIHTHRPEPHTISLANVRLQSATPVLPEQGFFSAGIHPWDAAQAQDDWLDIFSADCPRLLAVGEAGLDLRPAYAPRNIQEKWLQKQIGIAKDLRKPLIIHNVHATDALMAFLARRGAVPVILHGFTGAPELARQWLREVPEVRFSFGVSVLKSPKTAATLRWAAAEKPERLFLETDDAPDTDISEMYDFAAALTGWETDRLKERIALNFNILFPEITLL